MDPEQDLEATRLRALRSLGILDTAPEAEFDAFVNAAALVCATPVSLITLVEDDRQWFKANLGLESISQTPRTVSFCAHAMSEPDLMEIEDATIDRRFAENPLVTGEPHIRFYAGAPLRLSSGINVGTLCVIDHTPRRLTQDQRAILTYLASSAARALEGRLVLQQERALRAVESRAISVLEHSVDAIVSFDGDGRIENWNNAAERLFGWSSAEIAGRSLAEILVPGFGPEELDIEKRLNAPDRTSETLRQHRDGSSFAVSVTIGPILSQTGAVTGATEIIRDIRSAVTARDALAASEERLRHLYEATPAMMHSIDAAGLLVSVSDRWLQVLGYQRAEVLGRPSADFLSDASRRYAKETVLPAFFQSGICENIEYQMVTRSGSMIDVLLSATMQRDDAGQPVRTMAVLEDITARRRAERELHNEHKRLEYLIEGTQAGTWEWNVQTGEARFNEKWANIVGWTLADLAPITVETWRTLSHPQDSVESDRRLQTHFDGHAPGYACELRVRHRNGQWVWVLDRGRVLTFTADGRPEWMYGSRQDITERRTQEEDLRKSQNFLARTGSVAGVGGWEIDLRTGELVWSQETFRIHGLDPDYKPDVESAINFYAPESRPLIRTAVENSIATGEGWDLELQLIKATGEPIWVRAVGSAEFEDGNAIRLNGGFQDISERITQRMALDLANERTAIATEAGGIGIWDADLKTNRTFYSDMWCKLIGYEREEIGNRTDRWLDLVHPDDRARAEHADADHLLGKTPFFEEQFRMRHKDGRWIWIVDRGKVTGRDASGKPTRLIGTHTDITTQRTAEEDRLLLSERIKAATEAGDIGTWEWRPHDQTLWWDQKMHALHLTDAADFIPTIEAWDRCCIRDAACLPLQQQLKRPALHAEYCVQAEAGPRQFLVVRGKEVKTRSGSRIVVGSCIDVTEQKEANRKLSEVNDRLGQFASVAAHDIQAPIRHIRMQSEMLEAQLDGVLNEQTRRMLEVIRSQSQHVQELVKKLLEFSRVAETVSVSCIDLSNVLEDCADMMINEIATTKTSIIIDNLTEIYGDEILMRQVFQNMIGNAIKYRSGRAPEIRISCELTGLETVIQISDNGRGIDLQYKDYIFSIFKRLPQKDGVHGAGIGLSLCQRIVEAHNGRIWLATSSPDGSVFKIALPRFPSGMASNTAYLSNNP